MLAGDRWVADGNYTNTLALRLERADTVVVLDMAWSLCSARALVRGVRNSGVQMPDGREDSALVALERRVVGGGTYLAQTTFGTAAGT